MSAAKHTKAWRDRKKQQGLCPQCGFNISINGKRCSECHEKIIEYNRRKRQEKYNKGLCVLCGKNPYDFDKKYCSSCLEKQRDRYYLGNNKELQLQKASIARHNRKIRIIQHYGGKCACCGEAELFFLAIDHINGGGNQHRRQIGNNKNNRCGSSSTQFYKWVEKNNFPEGFQVLCHNCNMGKHLNGGICPHNKLDKKASK